MEKTTIYFKDGNFIEYSNHDLNKIVSMISGNHLIITTKSTEETDNGPVIINNTIVYELDKIKNFVKITPTVKFNIEEENVSNKKTVFG
jgi:hypothetical protein